MSSGAPTGKWETVPDHLREPAEREAAEEALRAALKNAGARLLVRRPGVPEVEFALERPTFVIGRDKKGVDLTLDDELVSRQHARLSVDGRGYFKLEDLGSQNGLRFQGRPVRRLNLVDGDTFAIGRTEFTFQAKMSRFSGAPPPRSAPARADSSVEIPEPKSFDAPPEPGDEP